MELRHIHHTLDLAGEGLLSIRDGQAARIRCNEGMLWITEEGEVKDTILSAGDTYTIRHAGLTLLTAFGASRLTIEGHAEKVRSGRTMPRGDAPELAACA